MEDAENPKTQKETGQVNGDFNDTEGPNGGNALIILSPKPVEYFNDNTNAPSSSDVHEISICDCLISIVSILLYSYDVVSDVLVALVYYSGSWWTEFIYTTICFLLPSLITGLFRFRGNQMHTRKISTYLKILDFIASVFCLMPLLAAFEILRYTTSAFLRTRTTWKWVPKKPVDRKRYTERVIWLLASLAIMRLIETLVEAIPQIMLQLYITLMQLHDTMGPFEGEVPWQVVHSVVTSVVSCSWAICSAYMVFAYGSPLTSKMKTPYLRLTLMFAAYVLLISTRFFSLQYLLISFPGPFFIFCSAHWLFTLFWIYIDNYFSPNLPRQKLTIARILGNAIRAFSFIFVFSYICPKRFDSKIWTTYGFIFIQNLIINVICFLYGTHFSSYLSNDIVSVDALYLIVIPQIIFIIGFILLVWQNSIEPENVMAEEDEIQFKERKVVINKMLLRILGIFPENADECCQSHGSSGPENSLTESGIVSLTQGRNS